MTIVDKIFCVGIAFVDESHPKDDRGPRALLIKKTHPHHQAGKFNGIGGKAEGSDGGYIARTMVREFLEETGIQTTVDQWIEMGKIGGYDPDLHIFAYTTTLTPYQYLFRDIAFFSTTMDKEGLEYIHPLWEEDVKRLYQEGRLVEKVWDMYQTALNIKQRYKNDNSTNT